jgi:hypothetical protein
MSTAAPCDDHPVTIQPARGVPDQQHGCDVEGVSGFGPLQPFLDDPAVEEFRS